MLPGDRYFADCLVATRALPLGTELATVRRQLSTRVCLRSEVPEDALVAGENLDQLAAGERIQAGKPISKRRLFRLSAPPPDSIRRRMPPGRRLVTVVTDVASSRYASLCYPFESIKLSGSDRAIEARIVDYEVQFSSAAADAAIFVLAVGKRDGLPPRQLDKVELSCAAALKYAD